MRRWSMLAALAALAGAGSADVLAVPGTYPTIKAATMAARPGDVIEVGPGTYVEAVELAMEHVTLRGAGIDATRISGGHLFRPVLVEARGVVVEDLTIENGFARNGGGLALLQGSCHVEDCAIRGCSDERVPGVSTTSSGDHLGGGIFGGPGTALRLEGVLLEDNAIWHGQVGRGGALAFVGDHLEVSECVVVANHVRNEGQGSALFVASDDALFEDTDFLGNGEWDQFVRGGAIHVEGDRARILGCTFEEHWMVQGRGTCAHVVGDDLEIGWCLFDGNGTKDCRGSVEVTGDRTHAHDCAVPTNWAEYGGVLSIDGEDATLERIWVGFSSEDVFSFSGSTQVRDVSIDSFDANYGGAAFAIQGSGGGSIERATITGGTWWVWAMSLHDVEGFDVYDSLVTNFETAEYLLVVQDSEVTFHSCAFVDNPHWPLDEDPDSWLLSATPPGSVTFESCVLWNEEFTAEFPAGADPAVSHSLVRGGAPGVGNLDVDPDFVGGSEDPLVAYRPAPGSPLIDAGSPETLGWRLDLAGGARRLDGDLDGDARVDMGPFEFTETTLAVTYGPAGGTFLRLDGPAGATGLIAVGFRAEALPLGAFGTLYFGNATPLGPPAPLPLEVPLPFGLGDVAQGLALVPSGAGQVSNPLDLTAVVPGF